MKEEYKMWIIISGVLGIAGFLISIINLIHYFLSRRINLEIQIKEYAIHNYLKQQKRIFVHYQFNNKSQLPISITDMKLLLNNKLYCEDYNLHEIIAYKHKNIDTNTYIPTYNEHFPINLSTLSSHGGYLVFAIPEDNVQYLDKVLTFQIHTNRYKELQKTFALNELVTIRRILQLKYRKNRSDKDT